MPHAPAQAPAGGIDPAAMMLPYLEISRAMLRAHYNAVAMMEANRALADSMCAILRRQRDLALDLAQATLPGADRSDLFTRAAEAVRELGEAMIHAQLDALDTLQTHATGGEAKPSGGARKP